jgi:hypothetical protein
MIELLMNNEWVERWRKAVRASSKALSLHSSVWTEETHKNFSQDNQFPDDIQTGISKI